jgi:sortase A
MPEPHAGLSHRAIKGHWLGAAVLVAAALFFLHASWIPIKAEVAQQLLQRAWSATRQNGQIVKPWPWADTHPVGILSIPRLAVDQIVLAGSSGRNLAFGPALLMNDGSGDSKLEIPNDLVISGHRDTHFDYLGKLKPGDRIIVRSATNQRVFVVTFIEVVDSRSRELVLDQSVSRLSLVTCYPLDSLTPGGPLRYVVTALPIQQSHFASR